MINQLGAFLSSALMALLLTKFIIFIAHKRKIFDYPDERKLHPHEIPNLGGIAVFFSSLITILIWFPGAIHSAHRYLALATILIFLVGVYDDLVTVSPPKKLFFQLFTGLIISYWADIRITDLHGLVGVGELSYAASILVTTFTVMIIVNGYNLIDGINTLAITIGSLGLLSYGSYFYLVTTNEKFYALVAVAIMGSLTGMIYFNKTPARIFLGDSGAFVIGLVLSILTIHFLNISNLSFAVPVISSPIVFCAAVLSIPLFDTAQVCVRRLWLKKSPFMADRRHIHHQLLKIGFSDHQTTMILASTTLFLITLSFILSPLGIHLALLIFSVLLTSGLITVIRLQKFIDQKNVVNVIINNSEVESTSTEHSKAS